MRTLQRLLLCVICLAPSLAAHPWQTDPTEIGETAQDSTGQVWGINLTGGWSLFRWEADTWKSATPLVLPEHAQLITLARGSDGAVYGVWNAGDDTLVTRHQGAASKLFARFAGRLRDRLRVFVDSHGNVWVTEQGKRIFRVTPEGQAECLYTLADRQYLEESRPQNEHSAFNPLNATADARERIWFSSDGRTGRTNWASLEGVLIFDGEKFEHHAQIAGVPEKPFSIIAPADADHLWLAVADDQLYRVDIDTFTATPVPPPLPQAFRHVQKIFRDGQDTYVVSGLASQPVPEIVGNNRTGVLWRLRNGAWTRVINGLDMGWTRDQPMSRTFVTTAGNLWLGAFATGPWFIPRGNGNPDVIDWRYNNPLEGSESLFLLADGRLLISSPNQGTFTASPAELLAAFQAPRGVRTLNSAYALMQDARGHIMGILATEGNALSEWDGQRWTGHPLPSAFKAEKSWTTMDSLGRTWILMETGINTGDLQPRITSIDPPNMVSGQTFTVTLTGFNFGTNSPDVKVNDVVLDGPPTILSYSDIKITLRMTISASDPGGTINFVVTSNGYGGKTFSHGPAGLSAAIFDPGRGTFQAFPTYAEALQAQLPVGKDFHLRGTFFELPSFSSDGRICFRDESWQLQYFNGRSWQQWAGNELDGTQGDVEDIPFFDRAGNVAVNLQGKTWEYIKGAGWRSTAFERGRVTNDELSNPPAPVPPPGCKFSNPESVARDGLGTYWLTYQRQLYRAIPGLCVPQFSAQERQPFSDSRTVRTVYIDPAGNAFLETYFNTVPVYGEYVILNVRQPLPRLTLRAMPDPEGSVTLQFGAMVGGKVQFTWRVNGGEWNAPTPNKEITLPWLPKGKYRIEAAAVDDHVQITAPPAGTVVELHVEPHDQIQSMINKLNVADYSVRDAAVAGLVRQPTLALPLLQSAREKAGADQRWWIDAAIQQIKDRMPKEKQP